MGKNRQFISVIIGIFVVFGLVQGYVLAQSKKATQQINEIIASQLTVKQLNVEKVVVGNPLFGAGFNLTTCQTASATGTANLIFLNSSTTTLTCNIEGADLIDLNLLVVATTSPFNVAIQKEFSMNGSDYYGERQRTALSGNLTRTIGASTTLDVWPLANVAVGTTTMNLGIEPLAARWIRLSVGVGAAQTGVHIQIVKRNLINR